MAVTATDVKAIIETDLSDTIIDAFIADALTIIEVNNIDDAPCHSAATLETLQKYLAAHLTTMRERQLNSEKMGDATDQYGGNFDMGLRFSQYGQQAMSAFDCSGILKTLEGPDADIGTFGGAWPA